MASDAGDPDAGDAAGDECAACTRSAQIALLEVEGVVDCGYVREPYTLEGDDDAGFDDEPLQCVRDALEDGVPFNLVVGRNGTDSTVETAWVGLEDGSFWVVTYDSDICGGDGECTDRCGPSVSRTLCMAPLQADMPQQLAHCESPLAQREGVCGPGR